MRIKRLDGLRAVALLLVLCGENNVIGLGWTAVEVSFVLTGFLMTKILREFRTSSSYWSSFYLRRAVRIVPLFFLAIVVNKLIFHRLPLLGGVAYTFFLGDVLPPTPYIWGALGMASSIAVGVHFVLLWSVAVRFLNRRTLVVISVAVLAVEPLLRYLYTSQPRGGEWIFNLTVFRLDSLMAGSLFALMLETGVPKFLVRWSGWAAAILVGEFLLLSYFLSPWFIRATNTHLYNTTTYTTLAAIAFFLLVHVWFLKDGSLGDRILSWGPMLFLGRISYGIYLFHPLANNALKRLFHLPFEGPGEPVNRHIFPVTILISIAVSALLSRYFEWPVHEWGAKKARQAELESGDHAKSEAQAVAG